MKFFSEKKKPDFDPNEVLLDSSNLPKFNVHQFEGRIEKPISKFTPFALGAVFMIVEVLFLAKTGVLQIERGDELKKRAENNRLEYSYIFGGRGNIYDRNKIPLAWNESAEWMFASGTENIQTLETDFPKRKYIEDAGFGHLLGYLSYPAKDKSGVYYKQEYEGKGGVEKMYDKELNGAPGLKIQEVDSKNRLHSESVVEPPVPGKDIVLTVDSRLQRELYRIISTTAIERGFYAGAGVMMDVRTGEMLALTSFPEYDPQILSDGEDARAIKKYGQDARKPFLDRAVAGTYTPGSIVKPFMAMAALSEKIISPEKKILSTGQISIPNPYDPSKPTVFKDWKAHGYVDMKDAIAVSSDVYFYEIGGGYMNEQKGLGIANIEKYMRLFGFGKTTGIDLENEAEGVIPNPEWKKKNFDGAEWLLGNTYHTSIGQYGFQATPLQAVHAAGAIATEGTLVVPHVVRNSVISKKETGLSKKNYVVAEEGMRRSVLFGTAVALNVASVNIAAKTGTAELGVKKDMVNSWVIGFFPYENPKYAFAVVMERGKKGNTMGAPYVMRQMIDWMGLNTPEYFEK